MDLDRSDTGNGEQTSRSTGEAGKRKVKKGTVEVDVGDFEYTTNQHRPSFADNTPS
jgi:hypothetical protein